VAFVVLSGAVGCGVAAGSDSPMPAPRGAVSAARPAVPKYRLVRPAVVIVYVTSDAPYFQVRVRMNRALPTDRQVKVPVAIRVAGQRSLTQTVTLRSSHGADIAGLGCGTR
jgi:hypothetical protein